MSQPTQIAGPECCGQPMVGYHGGWAWECADAFYALMDDDVIAQDGASPPQLNERATAEHRALLDHLIATRRAEDL